MENKYVTTIDMGSVYDFIPLIREELGDRCPGDDVLQYVLKFHTEKLFDRINKAMSFRYLEAAREYNPSLPTAQECMDRMNSEDVKEKRPVWTDETEQRIREKLIGEYAHANNIICWASRTDRPLNEGIIKEAESADSMIEFIKNELGVCTVTSLT